jgi:PadR family transcriptional regulator
MRLLEYHVLLALAGGSLHGYAIKEAVARESAGTHTPHAGSLYRVLARLLAAGLVRETEPRSAEPAHPGIERRYYALSAAGRKALAAEAARLQGTAAIAAKRLGMASGR